MIGMSRGSFITALMVLAHAEANHCPSSMSCIDPSDCSLQGGKVTGNCTGGKMCCNFSEDVQDSCSTIKTGSRITHFKSPGYPESYGGSIVCQFQLNLNKTTVGLKLNFLDLNLPGKNNFNTQYPGLNNSQKILCDSDWFFIKGFPNWMPDPLCGDLTGYSTIIEIDKERYQRQVTIVFIMSSDRYKWNIQLTQISSNRVRKMDYCLITRMEGWKKQDSVPNTNTNNQTLMGNGKNLKIYNSPWKVSIQLLSSQERDFNCTGTIIDNRHVVTSASCFFSKESYEGPRWPIKDFKILTGNGKSYEILAVTFYFNFGRFPFFHDNIAMIRTKMSISFDKLVRPIDIPGKDWQLPNFLSTEQTSRILLTGCFPEVKESSLISVLNDTLCTETLRNDLDLEISGLNATGLESIGKYEGALKNGICLGYQGQIVEWGCPMVELDLKTTNPVLIGIFNHSPNPDSHIKYYTKIQPYWKWILMAIS